MSSLRVNSAAGGPIAIMSRVLAAYALVASILVCVCADVHVRNQHETRLDNYQLYRRSIRTGSDSSNTGLGCEYNGRWYAAGAGVSTRDACLRCACVGGALTCARRACAALPDPLPKRCHILHRKGACCPELHCPDGARLMEYGASARFEMEDFEDLVRPASNTHSCVEGGTVFSGGSAMTSQVACEQCFCLRGERRCVRPRCLSAPPSCRPRPSPGACCPTRYYCDHNATTTTSATARQHECEVDGEWVKEGERVLSAEHKDGNCTHCFCLHGSVRCQAMACSPPLLGCQPVVRAGECCPHQYHCQHNKFETLLTSFLQYLTENTLSTTIKDDTSLTTEKTSQNVKTEKSGPNNGTNLQVLSIANDILIATKVKRKTDEVNSTTISALLSMNKSNSLNSAHETTRLTSPTTKLVSTTQKTTHEVKKTTKQPEGTVRITVNGTINCTTELSTSLPLNNTNKNISELGVDIEPRTPSFYNKQFEDNTFKSEDIITDRTINGGFDNDDTFTVNVSSSLSHNNNESSPGQVTAVLTPFKDASLANVVNSSRKTLDEEDYDYNEPTLPPSLPNLKIIPFVAADAVVEDSAKVVYPSIKRKDEFPVYYQTVGSEAFQHTTKEDDVYSATSFPIYSQEPDNLSHEIKTSINEDMSPTLPEFTVSTSLGSHLINKIKSVTNSPPESSSTLGFETPAVNLFSPPVETEGGFVPKGPGIIGEYYAVYPSTPPGSVPNLTTSMLLDTTKEGGCITNAGIHVAVGEAVPVFCTTCTCAWGELQCVPRVCKKLASNCIRRKPSKTSEVPESSMEAYTDEVCCGEIICYTDLKKQATKTPSNKPTNVTVKTSTTKPTTKFNNTLVQYGNTTKTSSNSTSLNQTIILRQDNINSNLTVTNLNNSTSTAENSATNKINNVSVETTTNLLSTTNGSVTQSFIQSSTGKYDENSNETQDISLEYEDNEDDDEGFSFGNVLKLLLSDNYEATTATAKRKSTIAFTTPITTRKTPPPPITRKPFTPTKPIPSFVPLPQYSYTPPKKTFVPNTVNRIDHLVLGEATAIKKRPPYTIAPPNTMAPFHTAEPSNKPLATTTSKPKTNRPYLRPVTKPSTATQKEDTSATLSIVSGVTQGSVLGPGMLKLDGCNIYGRMYRVGRIIAELSTPCQECRCTEFGVQCKPLQC